MYHFYVVCLLDCEQSLFSSKICKRDYLWGANSNMLLKYSCLQIFKQRETARSLYVFQCLQTFLLFSDRLNWRNNTTSNHEFSFKMSAWPCHRIDSGENKCTSLTNSASYIFWGKEALIYLFIYLFIYYFLYFC